MSFLFTYFLFLMAIIITLIMVCKLYILFTAVTCPSKVDMAGKTVVITGGNNGIGKMTALGLAQRNAKVIIACRNLVTGKKAQEEIISITGNVNVVLKQLDLCCFKSVRRFAQEIISEEERLDVLINNAAIMTTKRHLTEDGLESTMQTNHFGHFLLTNLLLGLLKKSAPSRVVVVSSTIYRLGTINFDNLNGEKYFSVLFYSHSKLANLLFARYLSKHLEGTGVTVNSLHPGSINTTLLKGVFWPLYAIIAGFLGLIGKNAWQGAQTSIYLSVAEDLKFTTGCYFNSCKKMKTNKWAEDDGVAKKLWEVSEKVTGLK